MVVEHEFVTTLEQEEVMRLASEFLAWGGFQPGPIPSENHPAAPFGSERGYRRGVQKAEQAHSVAALPQRIIIRFDRGRVFVAATITASHTWGGNNGFRIGLGLDHAQENQDRMQLHRQLLLALVTGLETRITRGTPPGEAGGEWSRVEAEIARIAKLKRRNDAIGCGVLALIVVGMVTIAIAAIVSH